MASSGFPDLDKLLGHDGFPDRSAVLVVGPPGIGKEAMGYRFVYSGIPQGDFCVYATSLPVRSVLQDMSAFGIDPSQRVPLWYAGSGGQFDYRPGDLSSISYNIKELLKSSGGKKARVVLDSLSPLLMLNPSDSVYKFLSQLVTEMGNYDSVLFATLEEGMHSPQEVAAMQQLFDGVIELKFFEEGLRILPLMRVKKMRGAPPAPGYYRFSISNEGMEVSAYVK